MPLRPHFHRLCHLSGPSVPHGEFDLTSRYAHVGQAAIVKPLKLEDSFAPLSLRGQSTYQPHASQSEYAKPTRNRAQRIAYESADGKTPLDANLLLDFDIRKLQNAIVTLQHG